jgi:hypothetical protein
MRRVGAFLLGGLLGILTAAAVGATVGELFGMPTMDLPAPLGGKGAIIGATYAAFLFGIPAGILGGAIAYFLRRGR